MTGPVTSFACKKLATSVVVACVTTATITPALADVGSSMESFWNGIGTSNYTGPSSAQGQTAGYYTGGNIFMRTPSMNTNIATLNLPSYRAGCGGIDFFAGGFSFINSDQLVALMKSIGTNAVSYAFKLALETISPMIAEQIGNLQDIIQRINAASIDSCESAKGIVAGLWPQQETASRVICEDLGNSSGLFTDRAAARHGCGSEGRRTATLASATGAMAEQIKEDKNIAWEAILKNGMFASDPALGELAMSLSGTIIMRAGANDDAGPQFSFHMSRVTDSDLVRVMLNGGQASILRCDEKLKCLNPSTNGVVTVSEANAFKSHVKNLLISMQDKTMENTGALNAEEVALLNATGLPIHKVISVQAAYHGGLARLELPEYADLIALDILYTYMKTLLTEIEKGSSGLAWATDKDVEKWRREIRDARRVLSEAMAKTSRNFNQVVTMVDATKALESTLVSGLSSAVRGNLAFLKGGNE